MYSTRTKYSIKPVEASKVSRYALVTVVLAIVAVLGVNVATTSLSLTSSKPSASASAQGKGGATAPTAPQPITPGGGRQPFVGIFQHSLPADFPSDVPLPTTGASLLNSQNLTPPGVPVATGSAWLAQYEINVPFADAMAQMRNLFVSNGYTDTSADPTAVSSFENFENAKYTIVVGGRVAGHTAADLLLTDVGIQVTKK